MHKAGVGVVLAAGEGKGNGERGVGIVDDISERIVIEFLHHVAKSVGNDPERSHLV